MYSGLEAGYTHQLLNGNETVEVALSVVVVMGSSLSLVGLAFAFITYSLFSDSADFGGTTLMNLLSSLFVGQLVHVIGNGDPSLLNAEATCLTLAFIQHYMWLSKLFWLLALVNDVQYRLTKVHGISRVSAKKIQQSQLDDSTSSQTLLDSHSVSMLKMSVIYWLAPLILTISSVVMETLETGTSPLAGDGSAVNATHHDRCWIVSHSPLTISLSLIVPLVVLVTITVVAYFKTMAIARGARQLLLSDDQFNHIVHCLSFVMKLMPLLASTLLLVVIATMTDSKFYWSTFQLIYSCHGLVTALILTCNCDLVKSFANVSSYFSQRSRNVEYGTGEVVSATDLTLLVWKDESNIV